MGLNDAQEMLDAARAQSVIDERLIAIQQTKLTRIRTLVDESDRTGYDLSTEDVREILDGPAPA